MLFLVVDDDALSRDLLKVLLEAENYEVELTASGEAAVARLTSCAQAGSRLPDVILTDIQMPGLSGNALANVLKPLLPPGTSLLAMSGSQPAASALAGFDGFLLKPFEMTSLKSMIALSRVGDPAPETAKFHLPGQDAAPVDRAGSRALNEDIYSKMCDLMPPAQLAEMYTLCLEDARRRIVHMESLAVAEDDVQYRSEAHAVKGGSGMIGASELHELAAVAEQDGLMLGTNRPGTSSVTATLSQLSLACDRLERILQERTRE